MKQLKYYNLSSWLITKEYCLSPFPVIDSFFALCFIKYFKKEADDNFKLQRYNFLFHFNNNKLS